MMLYDFLAGATLSGWVGLEREELHVYNNWAIADREYKQE